MTREEDYIAATYFDTDSWAKRGLNWLRQARSAGLSGFVICNGLPSEVEDKIQEMGFKAVPVVPKYGDDRDYLHTLAENMGGHQRCLYTRPEHTPKGGLLFSSDVLCKEKRSGRREKVQISGAIGNLGKRAVAVSLLEKQQALYSLNSVLGVWRFWIGLAGFQSYLHEKQYLDRAADELIFNLYIATVGSLKVEIGDV